jgi:hypothetical protein
MTRHQRTGRRRGRRTRTSIACMPHSFLLPLLPFLLPVLISVIPGVNSAYIFGYLLHNPIPDEASVIKLLLDQKMAADEPFSSSSSSSSSMTATKLMQTDSDTEQGSDVATSLPFSVSDEIPTGFPLRDASGRKTSAGNSKEMKAFTSSLTSFPSRSQGTSFSVPKYLKLKSTREWKQEPAPLATTASAESAEAAGDPVIDGKTTAASPLGYSPSSFSPTTSGTRRSRSNIRRKSKKRRPGHRVKVLAAAPAASALPQVIKT